jgi:hypothetical protein
MGDSQAAWEGVQRVIMDMALKSGWVAGAMPEEFIVTVRGEVRKATPATDDQPARSARIVFVGELTEVSRLQHVVAKAKP